VHVEITVLNRYTLSDPLPGVVRTSVMRKASVLGNPEFLPRGSSLEAREANVQRYRQWLRQGYQARGPVREELERLLAMAQRAPLELVCCCAPLRCHADEIKAALEGMAKARA
jgi:hypothetical protein